MSDDERQPEMPEPDDAAAAGGGPLGRPEWTERRTAANQSNAAIDFDSACPGCGYNLRGLPVRGNCPECGVPAAVAFELRVLRFADPDWLGRLRLGSRALTASLLAVGGAGLATYPLLWVDGLIGALWPIGAGLALLAALLLISALWLFTSPNPAQVGREAWFSARRVARGSLLLCLAGLAADALLVMIMARGGAPWWVMLGWGALLSPIGPMGIVVVYGMTRHIGQLAREMGNALGQQRAVLYRYGYIVSWVVAVIFSYAGAAGPGLAGLTICIAIPAIACGLFFGVMSLLLPDFLWRDIERCLRTAQNVRGRSGRGASAP